MTKLALLFILTLTSSAFAQINSIQFVDCFEKAVNETINEIKADGGDTTRICDSLSAQQKDIYIAKFTEVKDGALVSYSAANMAQERVIDLYEYMKDDMKCYSDKMKGGGESLVSALVNSKSYKRNTNLTEMAINKMINAEMWDSFFSPSGYDELGTFDMSYCQK